MIINNYLSRFPIHFYKPSLNINLKWKFKVIY